MNNTNEQIIKIKKKIMRKKSVILGYLLVIGDVAGTVGGSFVPENSDDALERAIKRGEKTNKIRGVSGVDLYSIVINYRGCLETKFLYPFPRS